MRILWIVVIALLVAWLFVRGRQSAQTKPASPKAKRIEEKKDTAYHAVSIVVTSRACAAAKELEGRRFLSNAAPSLPLAECDVADCKCRYKHYADRRSREDRRNPYGASSFGGAASKTGEERRRSEDRRKDPDSNLF